MSFRRTVRAKLHTQGIDGGGIKASRGQDGDGDYTRTVGVDVVRGPAGFDVNGYASYGRT
jgi:hypothetical protein